MNTRRLIRMVAVAAAAASFTGTVIANETEPSTNGDRSVVDINSNSPSQLGNESATPQRTGDSTTQNGSDDAAAQLGSGVNENASAQLNNDTQATSAPPANSDSDSAK